MVRSVTPVSDRVIGIYLRTNTILSDPDDGMKVVDSAGQDVGTVDYVKLADPGAVTDEPESDEGETRPQAALDDAARDAQAVIDRYANAG